MSLCKRKTGNPEKIRLNLIEAGTRGDSGGGRNFLGGYTLCTIGHSDKRFYIKMCLILNAHRDIAVRIYRQKSIVKDI